MLMERKRRHIGSQLRMQSALKLAICVSLKRSSISFFFAKHTANSKKQFPAYKISHFSTLRSARIFFANAGCVLSNLNNTTLSSSTTKPFKPTSHITIQKKRIYIRLSSSLPCSSRSTLSSKAQGLRSSGIQP